MNAIKDFLEMEINANNVLLDVSVVQMTVNARPVIPPKDLCCKIIFVFAPKKLD